MRVVLVHGLWHGAWSWDAVVAGLRARGVDTVAVDLPMNSLDEDAALVRAVLDDDGCAVLVGHSYGGAVITAAGVHASVRHLVYLAAFALEADESISRVAPEHDIAPTRLREAMMFSADGQQISADPALAREILYHRASDEVAEAALRRLQPVSRTLFAARPGAVAWRGIESSFVVCTDDRAVAPDLQRVMAQRCAHVHTWDSDHSPNASRPDDVVALLAAIATERSGARGNATGQRVERS